MARTKEGTDLGRALAEVPRAEDRIAQWTAELEKRRANLAEVEAAGISEALADPSTADATAERMAVARAACDLAENTLTQARTAHLAAQRAVFTARAVELRAEAQALREEADTRQVKTDAMIKQLQDWEEGAVYIAYSLAIDMRTKHLGDRPWRRPKTENLRAQALECDHFADEWDDRALRGAEGQYPAWVNKIAADTAA